MPLTSELDALCAGYANPFLRLRSGAECEQTSSAAKNRKNRLLRVGLFLAAELGFEPRHTESESVVLPLHNSAKYDIQFYFLGVFTFSADYILS